MRMRLVKLVDSVQWTNQHVVNPTTWYMDLVTSNSSHPESTVVLLPPNHCGGAVNSAPLFPHFVCSITTTFHHYFGSPI